MTCGVHVWTDLGCGCSRDDHGWWIIDARCRGHQGRIPPTDLVRMLRGTNVTGDHYGPVRGEVRPAPNTARAPR